MDKFWLLLLVFVLVGLNALFVIAEYSLVRARRAKLEADAKEGSKSARISLGHLSRIEDSISACQVGITMTSIGIGALGEPTLAALFEPVFGGVLSHGIATALAALIAYLLITSSHIVFGEIVPKLYTIAKAEAVAKATAYPLKFFRAIFKPFIVVLSGASNRLVRLLGVDPDENRESLSIEELQLIIAESHEGGQLAPGEAGMLRGVFHLHEQQARQVMTPIPSVVSVDVSEGVEAALRLCIKSGHTRLVVTQDGRTDHIRGIVHSNSLAEILLDEGREANWQRAIKEVPIIPETKPLDDLLASLQKEKASLAIVLDEYGRTVGVVSVEDIIEEAVGEITDETDPGQNGIREVREGEWFVKGEISIADLEGYGLRLPVDNEAFNSIGGFVFNELGRLPKKGDTVRANGYLIRVESVKENRITTLRIRHQPLETHES